MGKLTPVSAVLLAIFILLRDIYVHKNEIVSWHKLCDLL